MDQLIKDVFDDILVKLAEDNISLLVFSFVSRNICDYVIEFTNNNNICRRIKCEIISKNGYLNQLKWAWNDKFYMDKHVCINAAKNGHIDIIQWAFNSGKMVICNEIFEAATEYNHFELFKWLNDNFASCYQKEETSICTNITKFGNLENLKWIIKQGYKYDVCVIDTAIEYNHFEILKWLHSRDNTATRMIHPCMLAAKYGRFEILKWLFENNYLLQSEICIEAIENGHSDIFKWAIENGCSITSRVLGYAAQYSDVKMLEWLKPRTTASWHMASSLAARSNNFEVIEWLHNHNFIFDLHTYHNAAYYGHFDLIKWLHKHNYKMDVKINIAAVNSNRLEILKWAYENGCSSYSDTDEVNIFLPEYAVNRENFEILKWLHEKSYPFSEHVLKRSVIDGNLEVIKWLFIHHACNFSCNEEMCDKAIIYGQFEVLKFLYENHYLLSKNACNLAVESGRFKILKWLREPLNKDVENKEIVYRSYWDEKVTMLALKHGHLGVLEWAIDNECPVSQLTLSGLSAIRNRTIIN